MHQESGLLPLVGYTGKAVYGADKITVSFLQCRLLGCNLNGFTVYVGYWDVILMVLRFFTVSRTAKKRKIRLFFTV
jgi:hypothetical protein